MIKLSNFKLNAKLMIFTLISAVILFTALSVYQNRQEKERLLLEIESVADMLTRRAPSALVYPMFNFETGQVEFQLNDLLSIDVVERVVLTEGEATSYDLKSEKYASLTEDEQFTRKVKVVFNDGVNEPVELGELLLTFSINHINDILKEKLIFSLLFNYVIALIIVFLIGFLVSRVVVLPIKQTSSMLKDIASGEGDLTKHITSRSADEIGDLADYFNSFIDALRNSVANIKATLEKTITVRDELGANTEESVASINQMSANIKSTNSQISSLSSSIDNSTEAVGIIDTNIKKLVEGIQQQASIVDDATSAVTQMLASIKSVGDVTINKKQSTVTLVETAAAGGEKLNSTTEMIATIAKNVDQIKEILSIINNIASQTNLLSMNAAIEAAHAGDSGKGFAVVADEIRKLSVTSSTNAKDINALLVDIIEKIKAASAMSDETQDAFRQIDSEVKEVSTSFEEISEIMKEMTSGSVLIQQSMTDLSEVSGSVMEQADEMSVSSGNLKKTNNEVDNVSTVVTRAMNEIDLGINEINNSMINLSKINTNLAESAAGLENEVNKFKID